LFGIYFVEIIGANCNVCDTGDVHVKQVSTKAFQTGFGILTLDAWKITRKTLSIVLIST
jgi:hypothetical protein